MNESVIEERYYADLYQKICYVMNSQLFCPTEQVILIWLLRGEGDNSPKVMSELTGVGEVTIRKYLNKLRYKKYIKPDYIVDRDGSTKVWCVNIIKVIEDGRK